MLSLFIEYYAPSCTNWDIALTSTGSASLSLVFTNSPIVVSHRFAGPPPFLRSASSRMSRSKIYGKLVQLGSFAVCMCAMHPIWPASKEHYSLNARAPYEIRATCAVQVKSNSTNCSINRRKTRANVSARTHGIIDRLTIHSERINRWCVHDCSTSACMLRIDSQWAYARFDNGKQIAWPSLAAPSRMVCMQPSLSYYAHIVCTLHAMQRFPSSHLTLPRGIHQKHVMRIVLALAH